MCHSVYPTDMRIWIKTLGTTTPGEPGFVNDLWYPQGKVFNLNFGCFWQQNLVTLLPWLFSSHSVACTFRRSVWHDWNFWKENESRLFFLSNTVHIDVCRNFLQCNTHTRIKMYLCSEVASTTFAKHFLAWNVYQTLDLVFQLRVDKNPETHLWILWPETLLWEERREDRSTMAKISSKDGSKVMTVIASPGQGPDRSTEVSYTDTKVS